MTGVGTTVGSLAGTSNGAIVALGGKTLTVGGNNLSTSFAGSVAGSGSLVKEGTGTLTITSGGRINSGATIVSQGTLEIHARHPGTEFVVTIPR